jgi:hypothetical protein
MSGRLFFSIARKVGHDNLLLLSGDGAHNPSMSNRDSAYSVNQPRLQHGLHHLILCHQLVLINHVFATPFLAISYRSPYC